MWTFQDGPFFSVIPLIQTFSQFIEDERARIKSFLDDNRELVESCENSDTIPGRVRAGLVVHVARVQKA